MSRRPRAPRVGADGQCRPRFALVKQLEGDPPTVGPLTAAFFAGRFDQPAFVLQLTHPFEAEGAAWRRAARLQPLARHLGRSVIVPERKGAPMQLGTALVELRSTLAEQLSHFTALGSHPGLRRRTGSHRRAGLNENRSHTEP